MACGGRQRCPRTRGLSTALVFSFLGAEVSAVPVSAFAEAAFESAAWKDCASAFAAGVGLAAEGAANLAASIGATDITPAYRPPAPILYSSVASRTASAKPSVVTIPVRFDRPSASNASGIIVSASIVRIAPAANAWMKAIVSPDASPSAA